VLCFGSGSTRIRSFFVRSGRSRGFGSRSGCKRDTGIFEPDIRLNISKITQLKSQSLKITATATAYFLTFYFFNNVRKLILFNYLKNSGIKYLNLSTGTRKVKVFGISGRIVSGIRPHRISGFESCGKLPV
jgi:hypothetical protein